MNIEELSPGNIRQLVDLAVELWTDCNVEEEYQHYDGLINSGNEIVYVVTVDRAYVAFIHLSIRSEYVEGTDELPVAYIEGIYVKPNYQKKGMAKRLVSEAEKWARAKGVKQIASDAPLTNMTSIKFHHSAGFREVERIVCFVKDL